MIAVEVFKGLSNFASSSVALNTTPMLITKVKTASVTRNATKRLPVTYF